jgi:HAMP domain-containing protein
MITLAINIALMGAILVGGILFHLKLNLPNTFGPAELGSLAQKIAAGNLSAIRTEAPAFAQIDASGSLVHAALMRGFGWVMLYGGVGVAVLAVLSFVISGRGSRRLENAETQQAARCDSC